MILVPFLLLVACGPRANPDDTSQNTGTTTSVTTDSGTSDTGISTTVETGETGETYDSASVTNDTGEWVEFGSITGDCGVLTTTNLSDDSPWVFSNSIDFGSSEFHEWRISTEADYILEADNAGGSSLYSEIYAFEVLRRCEEAALLKTETEVIYNVSDGSITDLLLEIDELKIGVSVTRAYGWPPEDPYTEEMAITLLEKKLNGIIESSANVAPEDSWEKQVLHVLAYTSDHADTIIEVFNSMDSSLTVDTVLFVTTTEGEDEFLY